MILDHKHAGVLAGWIYLPGLLMMVLGTSIFLFPSLFPSIMAGCFILAGLMLIQFMRTLRKAAKRIRKELDLEGGRMEHLSPADLLPHRVYTSYIN